MKEYEVIWKVEFFRIVRARSKEEARNVVDNIANQFLVLEASAKEAGGNQVEDSFAITEVIAGVREGGAFVRID
ncbi:hypothetical protein KAR91_12340 [Candidatus Pacearchaeota archaeon]|nr:hypothetical protein [Candidatus Pacearchaeota archaeon]